MGRRRSPDRRRRAHCTACLDLRRGVARSVALGDFDPSCVGTRVADTSLALHRRAPGMHLSAGAVKLPWQRGCCLAGRESGPALSAEHVEADMLGTAGVGRGQGLAVHPRRHRRETGSRRPRQRIRHPLSIHTEQDRGSRGPCRGATLGRLHAPAKATRHGEAPGPRRNHGDLHPGHRGRGHFQPPVVRLPHPARLAPARGSSAPTRRGVRPGRRRYSGCPRRPQTSPRAPWHGVALEGEPAPGR